MSCENIPSIADLEKTKLHADDFGRLMGTGARTSTNGVTGQVRPTYNAVMANLGYTRVGTFATGATLLNGRQTILWDVADGGDGQEYGWSGSFPLSGKVVPPGSTPASTGGISVGAWISRFDPGLKNSLTSFGGVLEPEAEWTNVPAYSDSELGGPDGPLNAQAKALVNRTSWIQQRMLADFWDSCPKDGSEASGALQELINTVSAAGGGVIRIPQKHSGIVKLSNQVAMKAGVSLDIEDTVLIDCTGWENATTSTPLITANGTYGPEINTSVNLTSGGTAIVTDAPHNLAVGDWVLIKSQRACLHDDAGPDWRLGETTENTLSSFFGEPVQVRQVTSPTEFAINVGLLFPNYRTDNTQETYASARPRTTIQKINFLNGISIKGGTWVKGDKGGSLFSFYLCKYPIIDIDRRVQMGRSPGVAGTFWNCLNGVMKLKATRPSDWMLLDNHAAYNSFKDISSWNCSYYLEDENGSQGWDGTFESNGVPSIFPKVIIRSLNSREDGATSHGGSFGLDISVDATNPRYCILRQRARFATCKVRGGMSNNPNSIAAVVVSGWGGVDNDYDIDFVGGKHGVEFRYEAVTSVSPATLNTTVSIKGANIEGQLVRLRSRTDASLALSGLTFTLIEGRNCFGALLTIGSYIHGVVVNHIKIINRRAGSSGSITIEANSCAHVFGIIEKIGGDSVALIGVLANTDSTVDGKYGVFRYRRTGPTLIDGLIGADNNTAFNLLTDGYVFKNTDSGLNFVYQLSADITVTIPTEVSANRARAFDFTITQGGTGKVTIAAETGVTLVSPSGLFQTKGAGSRVQVRSVNTNRFSVSGDV